ncbi:MAG: DUF4870 domain-containing protein [Nocardioides sp.]
MSTSHYQTPQPSITPQQERTWGMLTHAIALGAMVVSAGTLGFVASLVIYLSYRDKGPFVRAHAANSLNIQIMTGIGLVLSVIAMLLLVGFVTYFLVLGVAFVLHLVGAVKASSGQWWEPPLTPRFVR